MMEQMPKRIFRHFNMVYAIVLLLGVCISLLVYFSGEQIEKATHQLVKRDIQSYVMFQTLRNELSEQERNLYEYYTSFDDNYYHQGYQQSRTTIADIVNALDNEFGTIPPLENIRNSQKKVSTLAESLHQNLQLRDSNNTDWDLARQQLSQISQTRRSTSPYINQLTAITSSRINNSQVAVEDNLNRVLGIVFAYSLLSLLIAFFVGRAVKAYMVSNVKNQRLSLFPKRTPNPIISLDENNKITYANPATRRLLKKLGRQPDEVGILLSGELERQQQFIRDKKRNFDTYEYVLGDITLLCELHFLNDQNQWDLHITDVTAQKKAEQKLHFQAYRNPETGLENQYKFREVLAQSCQHDGPFSLGLIEIRSYNQMLASLSFDKAQKLVSAISAILDKTCHDFDNNIELYHIGDKNFAVRIPGSSCKTHTRELVSALNELLRKADYIDGQKIQLDFGFVCFPTDEKDVEQLINYARIALNESASDPHSDYKMFDEAMGNKIKRQRELRGAIQQTINEQGFQLYFQPQYSPQKETMTGAEVLVRWHRDEQWISPSEFIPIAENSGLIIPLGDWVLRTACKKAKEIYDGGHHDLVFAVNISPKQFSSPDFVDSVSRALKNSGLPAKNLELEITEGVIFNDELSTIDSLNRLKEMGVMLAIDDFGTGYSSLSYLRQFPIDKLKIDKSFIHNIHTNQADQSIVRTIIDLGNNLDLTLIAEGVEQEEQVNMLHSMGCDVIQGDWYSEPLDDGYFLYFLQSQQVDTN